MYMTAWIQIPMKAIRYIYSEIYQYMATNYFKEQNDTDLD
jgi:hypothetical protein